MIEAKTLVTLVHCCTSANFQSVCLVLFMFSFFALFFNVLYEPYYFFTSNTSNRNNIRSTIFILATCFLLIFIPSSEYNSLLLSCLLLFSPMIIGKLISLNMHRRHQQLSKAKNNFHLVQKTKSRYNLSTGNSFDREN